MLSNIYDVTLIMNQMDNKSFKPNAENGNYLVKVNTKIH